MESTLPSYHSEYQFLRLTAKVLLGLTVMLIFVPLNPAMPAIGGDPSWMFGMNQAVAQKLVFGKDIVFTMGPYCSVYTKLYHPATDGLMLFGGLFLGVSCVVLLNKLIGQRTVIWQLLLTAFLAGGLFSRDALMYMYPLLLSFYIYRETTVTDNSSPLSFATKITYSFLFFPLGLLLLIKGSLLILIGGIVGLSAVLFWIRGMKKLAVMVVLMPFFSAVIFTAIAKQPIWGLWYYFKTMLPLITGYGEAMAVYNDRKSEYILYLLASLAMIYVCYKGKNTGRDSRLFLTLSLAIYLFVAFKGGFVRHDGHALTSSVSLLIAAFLLHTIIQNKYLYLVFLFSAFTWIYISYTYVGQNVLNAFKPFPAVYAESIDGMMSRLSDKNSLRKQYTDRLNDIRKQQPVIPPLAGTTDLYSYEQTFLLASGNKWSPRPVIQSYSVYTPGLAKINEAHLLGNRAPDNIIFRLQSIDNRIPSLDDGLSWPVVLNNYQSGHIESGFLFMKKKRTKNISPRKIEVYKRSCRLNEEIFIPDSNQVLFANVDVNQTFIGNLIAAAYRPEPLKIVVTLMDGSTREYRTISAMMKTGFILSPLVDHVEEFAALPTDSAGSGGKFVRSFRISNDAEGFRNKFKSWKSEYTLRLSRVIFDK